MPGSSMVAAVSGDDVPTITVAKKGSFDLT